MKTNSTQTTKKSLATACVAVVLCAPAGLSQVTEMLHETQDGTRDNYTGVIGCEFRIGSSNVVVSHIGIYDNNGDGLARDHIAGIFNGNGSAVLGQATFTSGTAAYLTNSVRWMPLDPPLLLNANTLYTVAGEVFSGSGDPWKDSFAPTNWNSRFVGTNSAASTTRYSPGGLAWPAFPNGAFGSGTTYGNVTMGYIEIDKARAGVASTNVAISAGQPLSLVGFASGATGINYQWWKGGEMLNGRTTPSFTIPNPAVADSGTYYLTASNSLGGSKSADVTVTVTAFPVGVQSGPTNLTVLANYLATFSAVVTGSPPIAVQWFRNGSPIPGATDATYSFTAVSANNGDQFSIGASNNISGTPYLASSSSATLTVTPNFAQPKQLLHGARNNTSTNAYAGCVGGSFITGNRETLVTHLGYYATKYTDPTHASLSDDHTIYIFNPDYTTNAMVVVSAGTHLPVIDGYIWAPLNPPVKLAANSTYILGADTTLNDPWGDSYVVNDWSSYYTDPANANSFQAKYNNPGRCPYYGNYNGQMYSAPNMAVLPVGAPSAWVSPSSVTQWQGMPVTLNGLVNGEAPITVQWFKGTPPGTLLPGQTNLNLTLNDPLPVDSGYYYLEAVSGLNSAQSTLATINIMPAAGPEIVQDISSQAVYRYSTARFTVEVGGTPEITYQWTFNEEPIQGATNSSYVITNVSSANVGAYKVSVTNDYGWDESSSASLTLLSAPAPGSYEEAVMSPSLLAYYRFSDVNQGTGIATNMGALGFAANGTYRGFVDLLSGPVDMSNFGPNNPALYFDGSTVDVEIPPLNVTLSSATIAAWIYTGGGQENDDAIYYHRGSGVLGLTVFPETNSVKYTWAGANYNFQSALVPPVNQWVLVAMSVSPGKAVVYLHDGSALKGATNIASHPPQTFNNHSYVGWDTAGGLTGRRWTGGIDELMIFDRALTDTEVNALYLGVPSSANLTITRSESGLQVSWTAGMLMEATDLDGEWTPLPTATSPHPVTPSGEGRFYRVQLQP